MLAYREAVIKLGPLTNPTQVSLYLRTPSNGAFGIPKVHKPLGANGLLGGRPRKQ